MGVTIGTGPTLNEMKLQLLGLKRKVTSTGDSKKWTSLEEYNSKTVNNPPEMKGEKYQKGITEKKDAEKEKKD